MDIEETSETAFISIDWARKNHLHVLEVKGDSLDADGLRDGDRLIVERRETAKDGELVVVRSPNNAPALGRVFLTGDVIKLQSPWPLGRVTVIGAQDPTIQGVVLGILRKHRAAGRHSS